MIVNSSATTQSIKLTEGAPWRGGFLLRIACDRSFSRWKSRPRAYLLGSGVCVAEIGLLTDSSLPVYGAETAVKVLAP
jgi:hypothetical protein